MSLLQERRDRATARLASLREELERGTEIARARACVYVTGSYGRGEASEYSDLDWFMVTRDASSVDADRIKARLNAAVEQNGIPKGEADYGLVHPVGSLVSNIGTDDDDAKNSLTARLLLLLESKPILDDEFYRDVLDRVLQSYWRDFNGNERTFVPGFVANDILRMWRTFCVNYEARTQNDPPEKKAKRSLKNYKLKHSRLLTCYSAIAYLLMVFEQRRTVTPEDARQMVALMPTARIESIGDQVPAATTAAQKILSLYERFLAATDAPQEDLVSRLLDRDERRRIRGEASELGDAMYELLTRLGQDGPLFRLLVV